MSKLANVIKKKQLLEEEIGESITKFLQEVVNKFPKDHRPQLYISINNPPINNPPSLMWDNITITHNRDDGWMVFSNNQKLMMIYTTIPTDIKNLLIVLRNTKAVKSL